MSFTPQQQQQVIAVLDAKVRGPCPYCGVRNRQLQPDLVLFQAQELVAISIPVPHYQSIPTFFGYAPPNSSIQLMPRGVYPCIAVICLNCGRMEFYNVHVLGVGQILGVPAAGEPIGNP